MTAAPPFFLPFGTGVGAGATESASDVASADGAPTPVFFGFFFYTPPDATTAGPGMGVAARSCSAWGASICDGAACGFAFRFVIFCMSERLRASNRLRKTDEDVLNLRH